MIERYKDKALHEVWCPAEVYRRWFEVELAHVRQVAGPDVADEMAKVRVPTPAQVNYYERETNHDVAAFLRAVDENVKRSLAKAPESAAPFLAVVRSSLHFGLTSSDVVDTALALGLLRSRQIVEERVTNLMEGLGDFVTHFKLSDQTLGRTHGQLAAPMPAEHRWEVLSQMLDRAWTRVNLAFDWVDVGKLSGPVGVDTLDQYLALERLGLRETESTQIVPRDRLAHWAHCLAELATVCEAIVTQIWLLAQSGIDEIRLTPPGTVGSSAMPHKVNPIIAENVRGLARMARSLAETLQLGVVQWGEHDLSHSSVERVVVPDLLHLVCSIALRTAALVSGLSWEQPTIPPGYIDTSEELRTLQAHGTPYVEAHAQLTQLYRDGKIAGTTRNTEEAI